MKNEKKQLYVTVIVQEGIIKYVKTEETTKQDAIDTLNSWLDNGHKFCTYDPLLDDARIFNSSGLEIYSYQTPLERYLTRIAEGDICKEKAIEMLVTAAFSDVQNQVFHQYAVRCQPKEKIADDMHLNVSQIDLILEEIGLIIQRYGMSDAALLAQGKVMQEPNINLLNS